MSINNRTMIVLMAPHEIIHQAGDNHGAEDNDRPIHIERGDRDGGREEGKDHCDEGVDESKDIDRKAPAAHIPGTEADGFVEEALAHHQADSDQVGGEEAGGDEGDHGAEGGGGADVDESQEGVDHRGDGDGPQGNGEAFVDL